MVKTKYCKSEIFAKILFFANSVKRHICDAKNSRLGHDLYIAVNDRVISAFRKDFYFHEISHMRSFTKIKPSRKFSNLQYTEISLYLRSIGMDCGISESFLGQHCI